MVLRPEEQQYCGGLELKWLQQIDCLTYEQWAQDIDAAMEGK